MSSLPSLDENTLDDIYEWIENVPFSKRRTKNISRDFSDGGFFELKMRLYFIILYNFLHSHSTFF